MAKALGSLLLIVVYFFSGNALFAQFGNESISSTFPKYSHQYTFLDDNQYYFIDTSFNSLHWYHQFNSNLSDQFGGIPLGNMGAPLNKLTIDNQVNFWSYFDFGGFE